MKRIISFLVIIISLTSCGQSNSKKNMKTIEDISNLYKDVEHFPLEPHYGIYISSSNTNFEIRVNDISVFLGYEFITNDISPKGSYLPINLSISKSGIQTIEVRMYPSYNRETQELEPSLKNAQVTVDVVKREYNTVKETYSEEEVILHLAAPTEKNEVSKKTKFIYPELTEYIFDETFEALVPYDIEILEKAQNLITTDPEEIKKITEELLIAYNEIWQIYDQNKVSQYADLIYNKEKRTAQQLFFTEVDSKKRAKEDILENGKILEENYEMMPFEDFKLRFYSNGKIVTLVYDKLGQVGRNKSVLRAKGEGRKNSYYSLFYKPVGSDKFILY
jgi:ASC-1-like (ASCH) protein